MSVIVSKGTLLKVLDHGYIRLIDFMGNDESIVEAARMSTGKGFISWDPYKRCTDCLKVLPIDAPDQGPCLQIIEKPDGSGAGTATQPNHNWERAPNGDVGLMDTLYRKKHSTPFEMGELVLEVQAPLFVFREWHRHRTLSYNEFSARYAMMPNLHYLPELNRFQKQSTANKQGSAEAMEEVWAHEARQNLQDQQQLVYNEYEEMVDQGLAKEVARINTPVSRYSKMRAKGNIRNWFQLLNLRQRPDAQSEFRQYADEISKIISWLWPKAHALFEEYDLYGVHFSRTEMRALTTMLTTKYNSKEAAESVGLTGSKAQEFMTKIQFGGLKVL